MKSLILASQSPQRKKLLALSGFPFKVIPSQAEEKTKIQTSPSALVKDNALIKAKGVSVRLKDGLVIGSDTVVYGYGKLILKPKSLKEAKSMLKRLMNKPHWVYSGVAVIDVKSQKTLVDFDKTKVFMSKLSDKEIDVYYRRMNPLDKAGGFDIEGLGSFFIPRIEGCYFNVVGLPLAKLQSMLKKFGVTLFTLMMITLSGCSTSYNVATQQQESLMFSTDKERAIGASVALNFSEHFDFLDDVEVHERVNRILDDIVAVCDRKELIYNIRVIDEEHLNAMALPGGFIYLFRGVVDQADSDDEIAGVIAHEIAHITAQHSMKRLQAKYGYQFLAVMAMQTGGSALARGIDAAMVTAMFNYSQEDEHEADRLGVKYMKKTSYDPQAMVTFLEKVAKEHEEAPIRPKTFFRSHPHTGQRIATVRKEISGKLTIHDYIKLTGEKQ